MNGLIKVITIVRFVAGRVIKPGNQVMEHSPIIMILLITLRSAKKKMFLTPILFATWVKINKRGNIHKTSLIKNITNKNLNSKPEVIVAIVWKNPCSSTTSSQIDIATGIIICSTKIKQRIKIRTWVVFIKWLSMAFKGNISVAFKS